MKILSVNNNRHSAANFTGNFSMDLSVQDKLSLASYQPNKRFSEVSKNVAKTLVLLPLLDTTMSFFAKNGSLSSRVKASAKTSAIWTAAALSSSLIFNTKKVLDNKLFSDLNKKHPVATSVIDFAMIFGVFNTILNAPKYLPKLFAKADKLFANYKNTIKNTLDNSSLNKNLIGSLNKYWVKNPYAAKSFSVLSKLVVPTIFVSSVARFVKEKNSRNENIALNYSLINKVVEHLDNTKVVNS